MGKPPMVVKLRNPGSQSDLPSHPPIVDGQIVDTPIVDARIDLAATKAAVGRHAKQNDAVMTGTTRWEHDSGKTPVMAVAGLKKRFRDVDALRGVSFRLEQQEMLALLGPNGAGKTTLIRCLAGRTRPDEGSIHLMGRRLPGTGGRGSLGLVPQDLAIYGDLTTRENLVAFGRFHGLRGAELKQRVQWALEWTGLADRESDLVGGFSGGMKRRVNIACGVLHRPKVLLLDEPTVGVDPQSRQRIFEMLAHLHEMGTSILLTTHHLDEAEQRCNRIVIIDHGRVIAEGHLANLVDQTIGPARHVRLRLDRPATAHLLKDLATGLHRGGDGASIESPSAAATTLANVTVGAGVDSIETRVSDVAEELPALLDKTRRAGFSILNMEVRAPSLHDVFLHLTGQELRD